MANDFNISLVAGLDSTKSNEKINRANENEEEPVR